MKQSLKFSICLWVILYGTAFVFPSDGGCVVSQKETWRSISASKERLYHSAKKILVIHGFQMECLDEAGGVLKTAVSPMRLNLSGCDLCDPTSMGGPREDTRPLLHVAMAIGVDDNRISIRATIHGNYPKDLVSPAIIEDDIFHQIALYLK